MLGKVRKGVKLGMMAESKLEKFATKEFKKHKPLIKKAVKEGVAVARAGVRKSKPLVKKAIKLGRPAARRALGMARSGAKRVLAIRKQRLAKKPKRKR